MESRSLVAAALILSTFFVSALPGGATLLRGYVSESQERSETQELNGRGFSGAVRADSLPASFEGSWQCVTVVTDSAVGAVAAGQKMVSDVQFVKKGDGRIVANWNQPGWTETQAKIQTWSLFEGQLDRTNYYFGEGMNGAWATRSRDQFKQLDDNHIAAQSYVDQYIDGQYLGRYRTKSVLTRLLGGADLALSGR